MLGITEQLGMWCVLFAMVAAVPSYALALLAFGGLTKEDLENIPFVGRKILAVGQRLGFFKWARPCDDYILKWRKEKTHGHLVLVNHEFLLFINYSFAWDGRLNRA